MSIEKTVKFLLSRGVKKPVAGILSGSGFSSLELLFDPVVQICYKDIPGIPSTSVKGHQGRLLFGYYNKIPLLLFSGRKHLYEGLSEEEITIFPRIVSTMKSRVFIQFSASGGLNPDLSAGDIVLWNSYFTVGIPFSGKIVNTRPKLNFSKKLHNIFRQAGSEINYPVKTGTSVMVTGPSYETKSEIRMFRELGGDVISMSSVPEAAAALGLNLETASISLVTNLTSNMKNPLSHSEVLKSVERRQSKILELMKRSIPKIAASSL